MDGLAVFTRLRAGAAAKELKTQTCWFVVPEGIATDVPLYCAGSVGHRAVVLIGPYQPIRVQLDGTASSVTVCVWLRATLTVVLVRVVEPEAIDVSDQAAGTLPSWALLIEPLNCVSDGWRSVTLVTTMFRQPSRSRSPFAMLPKSAMLLYEPPPIWVMTNEVYAASYALVNGRFVSPVPTKTALTTYEPRAALAAPMAASAASCQVCGMVRAGSADVTLFGEPSVRTNMMFGTPARSFALFPAPVLMPADVHVRPLEAGRPAAAPLNVAALTKPAVWGIADEENDVSEYRPSPPVW